MRQRFDWIGKNNNNNNNHWLFTRSNMSVLNEAFVYEVMIDV